MHITIFQKQINFVLLFKMCVFGCTTPGGGGVRRSRPAKQRYSATPPFCRNPRVKCVPEHVSS